jgi:hypothetical protein
MEKRIEKIEKRNKFKQKYLVNKDKEYSKKNEAITLINK